jgi:uncharacterized protein (TIGR03435 family)
MKPQILWALLLPCCVGFGQQAPAKLAFEVASIKPAQPMTMGRMRVGMNSDAGMVRYTNVSLKDCIRVAYRVKEFQVEGPDWIGSTRFDIVAKLPSGSSKDQVPEMLEDLLVERFKLVVHRDTKEHAIYALVVGKGGPKLKAADVSAGDRSPAGAEPSRSPGESVGQRGDVPKNALMMMRMEPGGMHLMAPSATLPRFAEMISHFCERPVVDMTGIQGEYNFDLAFAPETMRGLPPGPKGEPMPMQIPDGGNPGPRAGGGNPAPMPGGDQQTSDAPTQAAGSIVEAVQRYGLKLEPRRAPMETVAVAHIERVPTEN